MFIQRPPTLSLPTQGEGNADARNGPALVHRTPFAHRPPLLSSPTSGGGKADARARATREGSIGGPAAEPCYHEAPHALRPGAVSSRARPFRPLLFFLRLAQRPLSQGPLAGERHPRRPAPPRPGPQPRLEPLRVATPRPARGSAPRPRPFGASPHRAGSPGPAGRYRPRSVLPQAPRA